MNASLHDFEQQLDGDRLRQLGLVHTMLTVGPVIFLGVIILLHLMGQEPTGSNADMLRTLSMVHAAMLISLVPMSLLLPGIMLKRVTQSARSPSGAAIAPAAYAEVWLRSLWAVLIVRLAMVEGPALFGNVIVLLAVLGGHVQEQPLFWLNGGTTLLLLVVSVATFPTRERVLGICRRHALEG